jgi:hypothetical protein
VPGKWKMPCFPISVCRTLLPDLDHSTIDHQVPDFDHTQKGGLLFFIMSILPGCIAGRSKDFACGPNCFR